MTMQKKISIGSDHGGFELKTFLIGELVKMGYGVNDLGTDSTASVDYPVFAARVARAVLDGTSEFGIVICGTGIGISIAANRFQGIRAALCTSEEMAKLTREHNNSNILALGGRTTPPAKALAILKVYLSTAFEGGRHEKRISEIDNVQNIDTGCQGKC